MYLVMANNTAEVIGYVVVNLAEGDLHVEGPWRVRKDAVEYAKRLNFMHQTTRYAVKKLTA